MARSEITLDMCSLHLRCWQFILFNLVLGLTHMAVLFNAATYIAFLPHVAGDLRPISYWP
jgi:DHA2 family multidrug resistance protein